MMCFGLPVVKGVSKARAREVWVYVWELVFNFDLVFGGHGNEGLECYAVLAQALQSDTK